MQDPRVSVVIPVYNVAKYLPQCLESLVRQTLREIEIIAVDDGSTDGSGKILDDWALREPRLRVVHQPNAGAGAARNVGLDTARGDFLFFCDPDDTCAPEMLEHLTARAEADGSDVVIALHYVREEGSVRKVVVSRLGLWPDKNAVPPDGIAEVLFNVTGHTVWDKLFRRAHIVGKGIRFQLLPRFNDMLFCDCALVTARKISFVRKSYYEHLVARANGLQSGKARDTTSIFAVYDALGAFLRSHGLFDAYRTAYVTAYLRSGQSVLVRMLEDPERFDVVWNRLRDGLSAVCDDCPAPTAALNASLSSLCGYILSKETTAADGRRWMRWRVRRHSAMRAVLRALLPIPPLRRWLVRKMMGVQS